MQIEMENNLDTETFNEKSLKKKLKTQQFTYQDSQAGRALLGFCVGI